jgi:drug/metabolite transporter (DMT)-like permease
VAQARLAHANRTIIIRDDRKDTGDPQGKALETKEVRKGARHCKRCGQYCKLKQKILLRKYRPSLTVQNRLTDQKDLGKKGLKVLLAFVAILIIWGLNYSFIKVGLAYSPPIWLSFFRASSGFLGAFTLLVAFRTRGYISFREKLVAFLIGIPGAGIVFAFWFMGELTIPPGETSVLFYTFPIWTLFLSIPILGDRPSPLKAGASFLGFGGVALVAGAGTISWAGNLGAIVLVLLSGFLFAADTVLFKRLFKGEQLLRANVLQLGGASVFLLIWALVGEPYQEISWTWGLAGSVAWVGVLGTGVVFVLWFILLSRYNAASFTAYTFLVVLVALVASFFMFGEKIDVLQLVGVAALVASIYLVSKTSKPTRGVVQERLNRPSNPSCASLSFRAKAGRLTLVPGTQARLGEDEEMTDSHATQKRSPKEASSIIYECTNVAPNRAWKSYLDSPS